MTKRPDQIYMVTIKVPYEDGEAERRLVFNQRPSRGEILTAVRKQNAYYTDHFGLNAAYEAAVACLTDIHEHGAWGRRAGDAYISLTDEDFFPTF